MAKFGVKEVADVTFINLMTGKPELLMDSLKLSNLTNAATMSHATGGKGNARLMSWDFDRTATFDCQDALMDPKAIAAITGNPIKTGAATVFKKELITGVAGAAGKTKFSLAETPLANTVTVFKAVDGNMDVEVTTATVTVKDVEVAIADVPVGGKAWVFYQFTSAITTQTLTVSSDKFPGYYKIVGDTVIRNETTSQDEPFQIVIAKAKLDAGFNLTLQATGDPSVFDFKLEVYKPGDGTDMIQLIKY